MDAKKRQELIDKRKVYDEKLQKLYFGFRGVVHESAASELRYTQIKVYEDFIRSIDEELQLL